MKYLSPKADLTIVKVFGEHPDLAISFLNALLPFEKPEEEITWVEYLDPEQVPHTPLEDSIVDVRCRDHSGRQFIVRIQMIWTSAYKQRVLFNASKAYVSQLEKGGDYELLQPVYSLNLVNDTFSSSDEYYHDYRIVERADTREVIEGLRFIFIELPKFTPKNYNDKKMQVLWLRYLTEINEKTREVPEDLLENPEISKAVTQLEEAAFSEAQLLGYDRFWDMVSTAKMQISSSRREAREKGLEEGRAEGRAEGLEEGRKEGLEEGRAEEKINIARSMKAEGIPPALISKITGLDAEEIARL